MRHAMDWNTHGTRKRGRPRTTWRRSIQKDQKSGSRPTEMESNCGCPMSPMGQRGLDDDDDHAVTLSFSAV